MTDLGLSESGGNVCKDLICAFPEQKKDGCVRHENPYVRSGFSYVYM